MPVATAEKKGVMSAAMAGKVLPLVTVGTTDTKKILKITLYGKFNVMCGHIGNYISAALYLISRNGTEGKHPLIKRLFQGNYLQFNYQYDGDNICIIYISGIGSWGEFSALPFGGGVNSTEAVSEVPSDAISVTPE